MPALVPGDTIGIVGGGQLGRMLALAAARLGFKIVVLDPDGHAPAAQVANQHIVARFDDQSALIDLASRVDVITYEFENVSVDQLLELGDAVPVHPNPGALMISQDRLVEKEFIRQLGAKTAPFVDVESQDDLVAAVAELGGKAIVKTRRFGYDGKGQLRIDGAIPSDGFLQLGSAPLIAEGFIDFDCEISVIGVRSVDGAVAFYDPARNTHEHGILATSVVPAGVSQATIDAATAVTKRLLDGLEYVGVIGVEFFVVGDGDVLVNEFAPRVHNSGHWTEAACGCSQFEQHIRAVAGLPLGSTARHSDVEMRNLLGDPLPEVQQLLADGDWVVHLYGKAEARAGRKMGHATRLS